MRARSRAAIIVALFAASCSPTSPSAESVAGTWGGSTSPPSRANVFSITFTITQSGSALSGTWGTTSAHGRLDGDVDGSIVRLTATSEVIDRSCPSFSVIARVTGNQMAGTRRFADACGGTEGRIELTRE